MTLHILATGTLHKDPTTRTSSNGNEYTTAKVRVDNGDGETLWINAICFDQAAREVLEQMNAGDSVSVGGPGKLKPWEKDGRHGVGIDVTATTVAAPKAKPKQPHRQEENRARTGAQRRHDAVSKAGRHNLPFNDPITF